MVRVSERLTHQLTRTHARRMFFRESSHAIQGTQLTLADLLLGTWIEQLKLINMDLSEYANIAAFQEQMRTVSTFQQAHQPFYELLPQVLTHATSPTT